MAADVGTGAKNIRILARALRPTPPALSPSGRNRVLSQHREGLPARQTEARYRPSLRAASIRTRGLGHPATASPNRRLGDADTAFRARALLGRSAGGYCGTQCYAPLPLRIVRRGVAR